MGAKLFMAASLLLLTVQIQAAQIQQHWTLLQTAAVDSPFVGRSPGADLHWGTSDDVALPGRNADGYASYGTLAGGALFFYFGGSFTTTVDNVTGNVNFDSYEAANEVSCPLCAPAFFDLPGTVVLSTGGGAVNSGVVAGFEFAGSYDVVASDGSVYRQVANGVVLPRGFLPEDVTDDPLLIAHFYAILPALPDNWSLVAVESAELNVIAGPNLGLAGVHSATYYQVVPIPPAAAIMAVPLIIAMRYRRTPLRLRQGLSTPMMPRSYRSSI